MTKWNSPSPWFAMGKGNPKECQLILNMYWAFYCFISCVDSLLFFFTGRSKYIPFDSYRRCCKHKVSNQRPWAWSPSPLSHNTSYPQVQFVRSVLHILQYSLIHMTYYCEDPWEMLWQVGQEESPYCEEEMKSMSNLNV